MLFACVVPLTEILQPAKALKIAITFDDGYADNASTAAPLARRRRPSGDLFHHHWPARRQAFLVGPPGRRTAQRPSEALRNRRDSRRPGLMDCSP